MVASSMARMPLLWRDAPAATKVRRDPTGITSGREAISKSEDATRPKQILIASSSEPYASNEEMNLFSPITLGDYSLRNRRGEKGTDAFSAEAASIRFRRFSSAENASVPFSLSAARRTRPSDPPVPPPAVPA
jgi:hypothetical protein